MGGKRDSPMFVGKRGAPMFLGKRNSPMFVGKKESAQVPLDVPDISFDLAELSGLPESFKNSAAYTQLLIDVVRLLEVEKLRESGQRTPQSDRFKGHDEVIDDFNL